jgi:hypothetical protein
MIIPRTIHSSAFGSGKIEKRLIIIWAKRKGRKKEIIGSVYCGRGRQTASFV